MAAADKGEKHKDAADAKPAAGGGIKGLLTKLPVLLGGAMVIEAAVLLVGVKLLSGGPDSASAAEVTLDHPSADAHATESAGGKDSAHGESPAAGTTAVDPARSVELPIVEFRAPNKRSGRTFLYDVSIYAVVKGKHKATLETAIRDRGALLKDRIRTIIAQSDPEKLGAAEPGLETLRRQVKYQLEEIVGEGIVDEVLVPRCIPFRTDF